MAGIFILLSLALGWWVHAYFFLFTAYIGANLIQSAFTGWCPTVAFLRGIGLGKEEGPICAGDGMQMRSVFTEAPVAGEPERSDDPGESGKRDSPASRDALDALRDYGKKD
jgi:hypothetical protein